MPLYDRNITSSVNEETLAKVSQSKIDFADGGFYPFLKFFINKTTKIPNDLIRISGYGENNPFLEQSSKPKVFVELINFKSPSLKNCYNGSGEVKLFTQTEYQIYFVNDTMRAPMLFETAIRGYWDKCQQILKEFEYFVQTFKGRVFAPSQISLKSQKRLYNTRNTYPIVVLNVYMGGFVIIDIAELENREFDDIDTTIILK